MAFDPKPSTWIASWSSDGTNITVPIASFPELTAAEANATTGDIREVSFAICEKLFQFYNTLASADRPVRMTISKSASINSTDGIVNNSFVFSFQTTIDTQSVIAE
jgi:hypothetical protein